MIVRAIVLKDASATGTSCSCAGVGTCVAAWVGSGPFNLGGRACDVPLLAGLELLSSTAGGIRVFVQANSSSGFTNQNVGTDVVSFTSQSCRFSCYQRVAFNCASATSTDQPWYRAGWTQTCAQTNNWIAAVSLGPG